MHSSVTYIVSQIIYVSRATEPNQNLFPLKQYYPSAVRFLKNMKLNSFEAVCLEWKFITGVVSCGLLGQ